MPPLPAPAAHLHIISWVSSTRHISGFLSWPSYTMACAGEGTSRGGGYAAPVALVPRRPGHCGSGGRQVHGGQGDTSGPRQATLPAGSPRSGARPRQPPIPGAHRACAGPWGGEGASRGRSGAGWGDREARAGGAGGEGARDSPTP